MGLARPEADPGTEVVASAEDEGGMKEGTNAS